MSWYSFQKVPILNQALNNCTDFCMKNLYWLLWFIVNILDNMTPEKNSKAFFFLKCKIRGGRIKQLKESAVCIHTRYKAD